MLLNSLPEDHQIRTRESVSISIEAREDLLWWISEADFTAGRPLIFPTPEVATSDASLLGLGVFCKEIRIGGPWTEDEYEEHKIFYSFWQRSRPAVLYRDDPRHLRQIKD